MSQTSVYVERFPLDHRPLQNLKNDKKKSQHWTFGAPVLEGSTTQNNSMLGTSPACSPKTVLSCCDYDRLDTRQMIKVDDTVPHGLDVCLCFFSSYAYKCRHLQIISNQAYAVKMILAHPQYQQVPTRH